ncbi:DinI-like family protein [Enterobacter sp. NFR05]|nr:DinI-like family protein [Enterobacter sp. NFR05]
MYVEISIAKEKAKIMPKGSTGALAHEMTKRLIHRYPDVEVIIKISSTDGLSILRSKDIEGDKEYVLEILQEAWESADDWLLR